MTTIESGIQQEFTIEHFCDDGLIELSVVTKNADDDDTCTTSVTKLSGPAARRLAAALNEAADELTATAEEESV